MNKIKLNLARLSLDEKLQLTQNVITGLGSNVSFPNPNPSTTQLTTARTNITAKTNAIEAAEASLRTEFAERAVLEAQLDTYLEQEAAYVESASGGDKAIILSSGFPVRAPRTPVGPLPAPRRTCSLTSARTRARWRAVGIPCAAPIRICWNAPRMKTARGRRWRSRRRPITSPRLG